MKAYDEYEKTARPGAPFSNSTEWEVWQYNVCLGRGNPDRACVNDVDDNCPLILLSLDDKTPAEWLGRQKAKGDLVISCREKTTAADVRRAEREAQQAAEKAALEAEHYEMFPASELDEKEVP